jgi:hypothetical protein
MNETSIKLALNAFGIYQVELALNSFAIKLFHRLGFVKTS